MNLDGSGYQVLHHFTGAPAEGGVIRAGLVQGPDGALYGTTVIGAGNYGSIFKINPDGTSFIQLHSFSDNPDGANPYGGLAVGGDGFLYGTTTWGGISNAGTLFRLSPDGSGYSVLHHFTGASGDGANPFASIRIGRDGSLYGTTVGGGTIGFGTVFSLSLPPPRIAINISASAELIVSGAPGQKCSLLTSTNLNQWNKLADLILTNGAARYKDPEASILPYRFYRAQGF